MSEPDTYYRRTLADARSRPRLEGIVDCDSLIIGGGLAGLATALELVRGGQSVVVLEAHELGFGASGRNGGFVSPGYATDTDAIAGRIGADGAAALFRLSVEGMEDVRRTIADLHIESAGLTPGFLGVLRHDDADGLKAYAGDMAARHDYPLTYMDTGEVRAVLRSSRYFQALRDPRAFHIHPLNYLRALAVEIERLGGRIHEHSAVVECRLDQAEKQVPTNTGMVKARNIVFATGGYTGGLVPALKRAYLPIATYVMTSEEAPDLIRQAITTTDAIGDDRRAGDYYRVIDGGRRILWGGRITTRPASTASLVRELRREMIGTFPQLKDLKTELAWSGMMAYARHLMPQIGMLRPGVWYCTAFGGHGLNTTAIGGKVVAEGILGRSDRYRLFEPFGLAWAGGYAGLAVAQLTYWKLQAEDWWRERSVRGT